MAPDLHIAPTRARARLAALQKALRPAPPRPGTHHYEAPRPATLNKKGARHRRRRALPPARRVGRGPAAARASGAARRESEGIGGARRSGRGPARRRRLGAAADARARRGPAGHARGRSERRLFFAAPPGEDALVITGPPRSGTTLLLELLACDEETWRPLTGPEALVPGAVDGDGAVLTSALAGQALAFQTTKNAHFEEVDGPTECRSLLENAGAPYVFWWVLGLTGPLDAWLADDARRRSDYAFYRQELAAVRLAAGRADTRRWLLKDPCHLFSLDELFDTLPKARVVWLHRDPATVSASLCALLSKVWRLLYRAEASTSPPRFNDAVVAYLGKLLDAGLAFRRRRPGAAVHDLLTTISRQTRCSKSRVYAFAGEALSDAARAKMKALLADRAIGAAARLRRPRILGSSPRTWTDGSRSTSGSSACGCAVVHNISALMGRHRS